MCALSKTNDYTVNKTNNDLGIKITNLDFYLNSLIDYQYLKACYILCY